ncbi:MAG: phosphatase PAP2 family protein, partial [Planctomycetota bacterium]|nr:phosphatase PAP2 family protein [Planctomycetota bacterium]
QVPVSWEWTSFLTPSFIDKSVPLIPWTAWIYASYPLLFLLVYASEKSKGKLSRYLYAALAVNLISELIFILWPTAIDRTLFPVPSQNGDISVGLMHLIRKLDNAGNCFPSLHVSTSLLSAFALWRHGSKRFYFSLVWAIAIAISTMTTKQHYFVDVISGGVLAAAAYWVFFHRVAIREDARESSTVSELYNA